MSHRPYAATLVLLCAVIAHAALLFAPTRDPQLTGSRPSTLPLVGVTILDHGPDFLYVPVSLGGRPPHWFILDTGSYRSYVTRRGLARLKAGGLVPRKDGETGPLVVSVGGLGLGSASFALDTTGFPNSLDPEADGIVGLDLLEKHRIGIDVAKERFCVWDAGVSATRARSDWYGPSSKARSTDLWPNGDGTYVATAELANLSLPMCVDTGCAESYLSRELAPALRPNVRLGTSQETFYTGIERVDTYRVVRFGIEGMPLPAHRIGVTHCPIVPGLLGLDVLGRMRLLLDFPGKRLDYVESGSARRLAAAPPSDGLVVNLPTDVRIRYPLGEIVRVEPGCIVKAPGSHRRVQRPDGTYDLVPRGMKVPPFRRKPRLLVVPTVAGRAGWDDRPAHVPPKTPYTAPPGWRKGERRDGSLDLYPPRAAKGR